jgi:arylsulfatase A-like enzyme
VSPGTAETPTMKGGRRGAVGRSAGDLLRLALALGLSAGLLEAAARAVQRARHQFTWVSPDVVWVAPLASTLVGLLIVALLPVLGRLVPVVRPVRVVVFLAIFCLGAAAFLSYEPMHPAAALLLAVGIALQVSKIAASDEDRLFRLARTSVPWLIAIVLIATVAVKWGAALGQRLSAGELPAARPGAPNILLIVMDTVRAASLSVNGYERPTSPSLQRLAGRGAYFEKAVATSSWTLPSHATMFTGRYPYELSADWRSPLDDVYPTLAETLAGSGYVTAAFVANLLYATRETGLARGFAHYDDYRVTVHTAIKTSLVARRVAEAVGLRPQSVTTLTERRWSDQMNASVLDWLGEHARSGIRRPFFIFVNYMDVHSPYQPPPRFAEEFGATGPPPDIEARRTWTRRDIEREKDAYDGAVAFLDQQIGRLLVELERDGLLANTIIAITSDHGELFGEHGLYDHGNGLYWPTLHVPLLIVFPPGVPAGLRISAPVTLRDLPATLLELAAVRPPSWPGHSLSRFWTKSATGGAESPLLSEISQGINLNPWLPASRGDMASLIVDSMHYIRNGDGSEELYDLARDPEEKTNLAGSGSAATEPFRSALRNALGEQ